MNQALVAHTIDRRRMMKLLGSAGLTVAGVAAVAGTATAAHFYQEESHDATVPGPREDGTNLWKVLVGGMDMETAVE